MVEVRRASFEDLKSVLDFIEEQHPESSLADIPFDRKSTFQVVQVYLQHKDFLPLIALKNGQIVGILFGSLEPFFINKKRFYGTDLMFYGSGAGPQLWRRFRDWAFASGAEKLIMGVSSGDERADQLLEALGMTKTGGMYVFCKESG